MKKEILIHFDGEDAAVALTEDGQLVEIHPPHADDQHLLGNIYLGKVENVLPGMQAAFVNIGLEKNSFLYVEDAYPARSFADKPPAERKNISQLVKRDQQVTVQIFKEPNGTKGARVTMYPALPGRYLVLLPYGDYIAVSRRIVDEAERERLKDLLRVALPPQMGAIIRTVAEHEDAEPLLADLDFLLKEWESILAQSQKMQAPTLLHSDMNQLKRVIRDTNPADTDAILVENREAFRRVEAVILEGAPALLPKLKCIDTADLFRDHNILPQMRKALERKVWLPSGGYIIIDQVEALTAVDVNTGKYVGENNLNDTVFKTNMEAVVEIAHQLRLRNIGGIVIIDFIDMEGEAERAELLQRLEEEMHKDRVRITVMGMTQLGLVELTRKKIGHDLSTIVERECPTCNGKGRIMANNEGINRKQ